MKKLFYGFITLFSVSVLIIGTSACSMKDTKTEVTNEVEELETSIDNDLETMEDEAIEDVNKLDTISREKISEAIDYIHEHIDNPFEDKEITKKLYYYSSYIIAIVEKKDVDINNDIYNQAKNLKSYLYQVYTKSAKEDDDDMIEMKSTLSDLKTKLDEGKDKIVDEFYDLIK